MEVKSVIKIVHRSIQNKKISERTLRNFSFEGTEEYVFSKGTKEWPWWEGSYLEIIVLHKPREMEEGRIYIALRAAESSMQAPRCSLEV